jgi:hypothetical protein
MIVTIHAKPRRIAQRREHQKTADFKAKYRKRSGIESTNSLLKRVTGIGRLRVRGKASVFMAMLLKVVGWNILQASRSKALMRALMGLFSSLTRYCVRCTMHRRGSKPFDADLFSQHRFNSNLNSEKPAKSKTFVGCVLKRPDPFDFHVDDLKISRCRVTFPINSEVMLPTESTIQSG